MKRTPRKPTSGSINYCKPCRSVRHIREIVCGICGGDLEWMSAKEIGISQTNSDTRRYFLASKRAAKGAK